MRGAIFDMDGLLLDSEQIYQRCWHALARELGAVLPPTFAEEITGTGADQARGVLRKYFPMADPDALIAECKARVMEIEETELDLKPGAAALLEALQAAGWKLAVASSSPREMVTKNLERTGVAARFDQVICGGDAKRGKPFPDIFLLAAERLGLAPSECLVFEDSPNGLRAARAAGCRPIMVPDLVRPTQELLAFCTVYASLSDALDALRSDGL